MIQIPVHIQLLVEKVLSDKATPQERKTVEDWYCKQASDDVTINTMVELTGEEVGARIKKRVLSSVKNQSTVKTLTPFNKKRWTAIAAAVIVFLGIGSYFLFVTETNTTDDKIQQITVAQNTTLDLVPGGNKAVLTLANGSTIILDSTANGLVTNQGNMQIKKLANGQLAYLMNGKEVSENDEAFFNTITTPRGGQYQITLFDGSKVWLNASSSIRFPVLFAGNERRVYTTGEVYMEVAKDEKKPFRVETGKCMVEVLGTHFNINGYEDEEAIKTTLLEGKVKVYAKNNIANAKTITPGQQAAFAPSGNLTIKANTNLEQVVAWKNGLFYFAGSDIKTVLRQLARWYDVEVEYNGRPDIKFTGQLTRNENASKVFEKLVLTGEVSFKIVGKKIIVTQ